MSAKTYINTICNSYGGLLKEELKEKLFKLCMKVEKETINEYKEYLRTHEPKPNIMANLVKISELEDRINKIMSTREDDYVKCIRIAEIFKGKGKFKIDILPIDIFHKFWALSESQKNIIFDDEKDYQYFEVIEPEKL